MNKLEVFFDYACPYCLRGHEYLIELLPLYPQIEIVWRPCEAHPRPDRYGLHSDLCIQGMFYALEHSADIWAYHECMYRSAHKEKINIEDLDELTNSIRKLLDADDFHASIKKGDYVNIQRKANIYAFEKSDVWAVPSYRMNGRRLNSIENIGVTKKQLELFILESVSRVIQEDA